jgi:hypothetical protein
MLLQPAPSIHTAFMKFAIDVVFMDGTLRVVRIVERLRPWRTASKRHAWAILELAAGESAARGVHVGDHLGVVEISDQLGPVRISFGSNAAAPAQRADDEGTDQGVGVAQKPLEPSELKTYRPVPDDSARVLVVGTDRRFRSVIAALLSQRGCSVTLGERITNIAEQAQRESAEVVVLDAGASLSAAAREAAQIEALDPPVGIVVVGDETEGSLSALTVLPKWGSFDGLYGAIEHARRVRDGGSNGHR